MREAAATFRTAKEAVLAQLTFSGALGIFFLANLAKPMLIFRS